MLWGMSTAIGKVIDTPSMVSTVSVFSTRERVKSGTSLGGKGREGGGGGGEGEVESTYVHVHVHPLRLI